MIQGHVPARVWGFESPLRHHLKRHRAPATYLTTLPQPRAERYAATQRRRALRRVHHAHGGEGGLHVDGRGPPPSHRIEEWLELPAQRLGARRLEGFDGALRR